MDLPIEYLLGAASFWAGVTITVFDILIVLFLIPQIVLDRRESGTTLAWILLIVFLPLGGALCYWVIGRTRLRLRRKRRRRAELTLSGRLEPLVVARSNDDPTRQPPVVPELALLVKRLDGLGPQPDNAVTLFREGPGVFDAIIAATEAAKDHVHLLYYIWEPDALGTRIRDALVVAARRGIKVRVIVDDVGARAANARFWKPLVEAGGQMSRFLPVSLFTRRLDLNNRNHRKIVVVDGAIGFTGGMNVGVEYLGQDTPWRDAHVRVEGPSVLRLQEIFAQDWYHSASEDLAQPRHFPRPEPRGDQWVQFVASGPDDGGGWMSIAMLLFAAFGLARTRIWIQTPYFVPDQAMNLALVTAALRGLDVRLLLSSALDHPALLYAARSYYQELLAAGVKIYELPVMQHTKTVTIDSNFSTVGSANIDPRSFRLNFEANAFFYGPTMAKELERLFEETARDAREITREGFARRAKWKRFLEATIRIFAPIL